MAFELPADHVPLAWNEPVNLRQEYWDRHTEFVEFLRASGATVLAVVSAQEQPYVNGELPTSFQVGEGDESVLIKYKSPLHAQYRLGTFALLEEPMVFIPRGPETFWLDVQFARRRDEVARQHDELRSTGNADDKEAAKQLLNDFLAEKAAYISRRAELEAQYASGAV
jgi:hypothetical protein